MLDGRVEIVTGRARRRRWSDAEKLRIVAETEALGACFAHVAARHEISRGLLWNWRAQVRRGELRPEVANVFVPVQVTDPSLRLAPTPSGDPSVQPVVPEQPRAPAPHTAADQIEVELPDGSKLRVGGQVRLTALRRVIAALRG